MLFCNRKIEKRRGNFADAIFRVKVPFFFIQNYAYLLLGCICFIVILGQNMKYNCKCNEDESGVRYTE